MIAIEEKTTQKNPAKATVVNLGVSFLHLNVTEKTEKPIEAEDQIQIQLKIFHWYYQVP